MFCHICGGGEFKVRSGRVRDMPDLKILECSHCGLTFLESFDHISDKHYEDSPIVGPIHDSIGGWLKETALDDARRFDEYKDVMAGRKILDFGCGAGGFISRCNDIASTADGVEPERQIGEYYKGTVAIWQSLNEVPAGKRYDFITAFHVLEHLHEPREVLRELGERLEGGGRIIIEVPSSNDALVTLYESEPFSRFTYWSQHLWLFNAHSLGLLAKQAGLRVVATRYYQRYPLSNHLYWLSTGTPGGHHKWAFLDSPELTQAYESALARLGKTDTIICYLEKDV